MKWYGLVDCEYRQWMHILEWSYARQYGKIMIMEMGELWMYWR
jgi:hypothetical protein